MMFEKKENKNIKITIRLSESEKNEIDEYIKKHGYGSTTEFIRNLIAEKIKE